MSAQKEPKKTATRAKSKAASKPTEVQGYDPEIERELWDVMSKAWALTHARYERERKEEEAAKAKA